MSGESKFQSSSRVATAWRIVAILQCVGVVGIASLGAFWALSLGGAFAAPEGQGTRFAVEPTAHREVPPISAPVATSTGLPDSWTYYIVGSELEAKTLREAIAARNKIRYDFGMQLMREEVLVVSSSAEAKLLAEMLYEGNRIRASFGVEDWVVNLVG